MTILLTPMRELSELSQLVHWVESDYAGQQWLPIYTKPSAVVNLWRKPKHEFFLASVEEHRVGFVHIEHLTHHEASFSYYVSQAYRGRGLGGQLIATLRTHLHQTQGVRRLLALVDSHNEASKRSLTKAGFVMESTPTADFVCVYASNL